jgi:hypothetical protein
MIAGPFAAPPAIDRSAIIDALCLVLREIAFADPDSSLVQYLPDLNELLRALILLDTGMVAPMLRPRVDGHRSKDRPRRQVQKAVLVAGLVALEEIGVPAVEARNDVIALAGRHNVRASGGKLVRAGTLRTWRKKIMATPDCAVITKRLLVGEPTRAAVLRNLADMLDYAPPSDWPWHTLCRGQLKQAS